MIASAGPAFRIVLYEGAGSRPLDGGARFDIVRKLLDRGYAVASVRPGGQVSRSEGGSLLVLGLFEGQSPQAEHDSEGVVRLYFRDIEGLGASQIVDAVETVRSELCAPEPRAWKPWFPVIDYSRCTNCMECLDFCLFGVYNVDSLERLYVENQDACKKGCPACSRVCP